MNSRKIGTVELAGFLRRALVGGTWQVGDRLPAERQLAASYGVARGTLRSALIQLAADGLIDIRPGSGAYVQAVAAADGGPIANASPAELMESRFAVEPHICRLAVIHARAADLDTLDHCCARMEAADGDETTFAKADEEFHRALAECTRNGLLIWIVGQLNAVRGHADWTKMRKLTLDAPTIATYNTQHRQILDALRARDSDRAAAAMSDHLETARLSLTGIV